MLMAVTGSAPQSGRPPPRPLPCGRRWCVITEQRRAEWSDWWGDCGLLTEVFVWPADMCSHRHSGMGDWPPRARTAAGVDLSAQDAALTFHNLPPVRLPAYCIFQKVLSQETHSYLPRKEAWSRLSTVAARHSQILITGKLSFVSQSLNTFSSNY